MSDPFTTVAWPAARLGEAIATLGRHAGFAVRSDQPGSAPTVGGNCGPWLEETARWLGLEAEPVEVPYPEVEQLLAGAGPALVCLPGGLAPRFLLLLHGGRRTVTVLTPGLAQLTLPARLLREALCREVEAPVSGTVAEVLAAAGVRGRREPQVRCALLRQLLPAARVGGCWLLRPAGGAGVVVQARELRLGRLLFGFLAAHACDYGLWLLSWWLLGWMSLTGRLDLGWLLAWLLLLLTLIPFRLLTTALAGRLAIGAGILLKKRLLFGALKLEPEEVRHQGVGQLLGRVIESEVVELMALTGGFLGLMAGVELVLAGLVLGAGAGSGVHVFLLLVAVLATLLLGYRYHRTRQRWTGERLDMTNDLVERMVGHRTRLAQEGRQEGNDAEDQALERYLGISCHLDRTGVFLQALVPRSWFLLGFLALVPAFLGGERSTVALAVGVGGIVLGYRALRNLAEGLERLSAAAIAWDRIALFWQAAARHEPVGQPGLLPAPLTAGAVPESGPALLDLRDVAFRYADRAQAVLQGVTVHIHAGDRLLLEGPSGGGKSTLAALLAGLRVPGSGLLLLRGLDRATLGAETWRRRVVIAPQFHENHVLMGTFAFNVLMGRTWPPSEADVAEAERVCRALDLGPLLDRMPAGLMQMVGETGWQLSHGEKSRLFIARALLQGADLLILDESFAALDPQTLQHTLAHVLEKAPTVVVIAHP